jgi:Na+-driven multidrug efflux pump
MDLDLYDILELLGSFLRVFGSLVFGVGIGWLVLKIVKDAGKSWQLVTATMLGLLGTFLVLAGWAPQGSPATTGAFSLGVGAAILIWGLAIKPKKAG